jgi:hypothetical protein
MTSFCFPCRRSVASFRALFFLKHRGTEDTEIRLAQILQPSVNSVPLCFKKLRRTCLSDVTIGTTIRTVPAISLSSRNRYQRWAALFRYSRVTLSLPNAVAKLQL